LNKISSSKAIYFSENKSYHIYSKYKQTILTVRISYDAGTTCLI